MTYNRPFSALLKAIFARLDSQATKTSWKTFPPVNAARDYGWVAGVSATQDPERGEQGWQVAVDLDVYGQEQSCIHAEEAADEAVRLLTYQPLSVEGWYVDWVRSTASPSAQLVSDSVATFWRCRHQLTWRLSAPGG